jgi:multiple sugar transport system permease protein
MTNKAHTQAVAQAAEKQAQRTRIIRTIKLFGLYTVMLLFAAWTIFPLVFTLVSSGKPDRVLFEDLRSLKAFIPTQFSLDNYQGVFDRVAFSVFLRNSIVISTTTVFLSIFVNSLAAFSLARLRWTGRKLVMTIIIALIIIPFESIAVPLIYVVNKLYWPSISFSNGLHVELTQSWLNTLHVQIVPFIADAFSIFLFYQAFLDIPKELDESALVDGANPLRIYWSIVMPLARPTIATVAILQFLVRWNDYLWPVVAVPGEKARPLTVGIASFYTQTPVWGQILAYASMITIPVLVVFLLFQKWFIRSVATSGIKG